MDISFPKDRQLSSMSGACTMIVKVWKERNSFGLNGSRIINFSLHTTPPVTGINGITMAMALAGEFALGYIWRNATCSSEPQSCCGLSSLFEPPDRESDISPETGASQGFLHCPKDYGCAIRLRSPEKKETILREYREATSFFAQYD